MVISSDHGVANSVVLLKDITRGKAMDLPEGAAHFPSSARWGHADDEQRCRSAHASNVRVHRPVYSEPKTWSKKVIVAAGQTSHINFSISEEQRGRPKTTAVCHPEPRQGPG
jgi:hypothetical protein